MRLPLSKLYRAFPELDPFTDEQCFLYITRARAKHPLLRALGLASIAIAVVVGWFSLGQILRLLLPILFQATDSNEWIGLTMMVSMAMVIGGGVVCGLVTRDVFLRLLVRMELRGAKCPACGYSLLGLPVASGLVMCPECGARLSLAELALTPEDLIADVHVSESGG